MNRLKNLNSRMVKIHFAELNYAPYQRPLEMKRVADYVESFSRSAVGYPLVCLRDGKHWVVDGQHRIAALSERGYTEWICELVTGLTYEEEAALFVMRNTFRAPTPLARFNAKLDAGLEPECSIRKIVEESGWRIAKNNGSKDITAVAALERAYTRNPDALLVALTLLAAAWPGDSDAVEGSLIKGASLFFEAYAGQVDTAHLVKRLQKFPGGPRNLVGVAKGHPDYTRLDHSVRAILRREHNAGKQVRNHLPAT